jgi:hypothetical protein
LRDLLLPGALPDGLEAHPLLEHLGGVSGRRLVEGAGVLLQRRLLVAQAPVVLAQDLSADVDVDLRVEERLLSAVVEELLQVVLRDDLHQPLGADDALGDRVVARFDRHHGEDQHRVDVVALAGAVRDGDVACRSGVRDAPAPRDELRESALLALLHELDEVRVRRAAADRGNLGRGVARKIGQAVLDEVALGRQQHEAAERSEAEKREAGLGERIHPRQMQVERLHLLPPCPLALRIAGSILSMPGV